MNRVAAVYCTTEQKMINFLIQDIEFYYISVLKYIYFMFK